MRNGLSYEEAGKLGAEKTKLVIAEQKKQRIKQYEGDPTLCGFCGQSQDYKRRHNKFCNQSCAASFNNKGKDRHSRYEKIKIPRRNKSSVVKWIKVSKEKYCGGCSVQYFGSGKKYCSLKCSQETRKSIYRWAIKQKIERGEKVAFGQIRKYLLEKYRSACQRCGWSEINKTSGTVPVDVEHIDGNSENNDLLNLTLLCPNCHSLTSTYKGMNKGKGRYSRRVRYNAGLSF